MKELIKLILTSFGNYGLKQIVNAIASTDMFKVFIKELLLKRVTGLQEKYPEVYTTFETYSIAVSEIPAILTDDNQQDIEQIALLLRLEQFQSAMKKLSALNADVCVKSRSIKTK